MTRPSRFLLTRPADQSRSLASVLREAGIEPVVVPAIAILPPRSYEALDRAIEELETYDWVLFTSANGVRAFRDRLASSRRGRPLPAALGWAVAGPHTARSLAALGVRRIWSPTAASGLTAASELPAGAGARVLWVRGNLASTAVARRLRARALTVHDVVGYRTVEAPESSRGPLAAAWRNGLDGVVLASASAAHGFAKLAHDVGVDRPPDGFLIVAIGPATAAAAAEAGWAPQLVARDHTTAGIVEAITERRESGAASV